MAGDWIKVEHATLAKPELTLFAELLGVPVDQGLGLLVRFWMWLDANSRDGRVTHVSRLSVDTTMHTIGFSAALERVGWVVFDDEALSLTVPNFDIHNGNSAKSRALHARRQAKLRDGRVTLDASPREEKRRVSTSLRSVDKQRAQSALPPDFQISDRVRKWATVKGYKPESYLETFVGRHRANGKRYLDWDQTFMNCIREDWYGIRAGPPRASVADARAKTNEGIYGPLREMGHGRRDDEAIDGEAVRVA